jgi:hypothetical protein
MVHWQRGEKEAARLSYDKAVRWVEQNKAALEKHPLVAEELRRFREEAAQLLGVEDQPSPKGEKRSLPKK